MNPIDAYNSALAKRRLLQQQAFAMGVNEEYISTLVETFYGRVRADADLGPVFNHAIQDRWPVHMAKMKLFWSSVALRSGVYEGKPVEVHVALKDAKPEHFVIWMRLFEETLRETASSEEVVQYFLGFARTIAARLQSAMFRPTVGPST